MEQIKENLWKLTDNHYLKKYKSGNYNIIAPIKDPITNKINYFNLFLSGSWFNLIKVIVIVAIILLLTYGFIHDTKACSELQDEINEGEIICTRTTLPNHLLKNWGELNGTRYRSDLVLSPEDNAEILNT